MMTLCETSSKIHQYDLSNHVILLVKFEPEVWLRIHERDRPQTTLTKTFVGRK